MWLSGSREELPAQRRSVEQEQGSHRYCTEQPLIQHISLARDSETATHTGLEQNITGFRCITEDDHGNLARFMRLSHVATGCGRLQPAADDTAACAAFLNYIFRAETELTLPLQVDPIAEPACTR